MFATPVVLTAEQHRALHVLGYLFYRMGRYPSAERLFRVLVAAAPDGTGDKKALATLAAIALATGDAAAALRHVSAALEGGSPSSHQAFLFLLRGQALWLQGRQDEARSAMAQYIYLTGEGNAA